MRKLVNYFIKGLVIFVPMALTVFLIGWAFTRLDSLFRAYLPVHHPGKYLHAQKQDDLGHHFRGPGHQDAEAQSRFKSLGAGPEKKHQGAAPQTQHQPDGQGPGPQPGCQQALQ